MLTYLSYVAVPVVGLIKKQLLLPYKMIFPYDYRPLYVYIPTLLATLWVGLEVVSLVLGEANFLATLILHLNARYEILQDDVKKISKELLNDEDPSEIAKKFHCRLIQHMYRNEELNEFGQKLENAFTFRIFVMMANSAVLLCILIFKAMAVRESTKKKKLVSPH